jgi:hypothetical protein
VSEEDPIEAIFVRQRERQAQHDREAEETEARRRAQEEMGRLWQGVTGWPARKPPVQPWVFNLRPYFQAWAAAIRRLAQGLARRGLLVRLAHPPSGIEGDQLEAWEVAVKLLHTAQTNLGDAGRLLMKTDESRQFADKVTWWLCAGLRRQLESSPATTPEASDQAPPETRQQTDNAEKAENTKGKNVNGQMLVMLQKDASCVNWSARKWADRLDCSVSTVQGTTAWKNILTTRGLQAADAINRGGEGRRTDRRRFGKKKSSEGK